MLIIPLFIMVLIIPLVIPLLPLLLFLILGEKMEERHWVPRVGRNQEPWDEGWGE